MQDKEKKTADQYQHMREDDPLDHDAQTLDSATADQIKEQEGTAFPELLSDNEEEGRDEKMDTLQREMEELKVGTPHVGEGGGRCVCVCVGGGGDAGSWKGSSDVINGKQHAAFYFL